MYETEEGLALLRALAQRRGVNVTDLLRLLIREEAARLGVPFPRPEAATQAPTEAGEESEEAITPMRQRLAAERLREWVEQARAGAELPHEKVQQEVAILRAGVQVTPARRPEELDPDWADRLSAMAEQMQAAVPAEWTEEELQEQIAQTIAEVRASRAGHD